MLHQQPASLAQGSGLALDLDAQVAQQFLGDDAPHEGVVVHQQDAYWFGLLPCKEIGPREGIGGGSEEPSELPRVRIFPRPIP